MEPGQPSLLRMPALLHGTYPAVHRKARAEGLRCGEAYRKRGSLLMPRQSLELPRGEVVMTHAVADFQRERPAWRLYMVSRVVEGLCEALDWQNSFQVGDAYEALCRETAWGALHFAILPPGPVSAERTARRIQAVLRFWEPLQTVRYVFKALNAELSLEELLSASCDWAMEAWCPVGDASVRARLGQAAERMARATREDSTEAIIRQLPRALTYARELKHPEVVSRPTFWRQRLGMLEPASFEHLSGACTADLLEQLYAWDRQLGKQ